MAQHWYVLRSKPHKEAVVRQQAVERGLEVFHPIMPRQLSPSRGKQSKPYFPGYLFVRADLEKMGQGPLQWMPYTLGLVCFGDVPARIPDECIETIRQYVDDLHRTGGQHLFNFEEGEKVWIQSGPFKGYEAIFDARRAGTDRVRVLLKLIKDRYVKLELRATQLSRAR